MTILSRLLLFIALFTLTSPLRAQVTYTWDGDGDSNASGNWYTDANWDPDGVPDWGGDEAHLLDVTTGTRTVTISGGSTTGLTVLQMVQTTAGATNLLSVEKDFSVNAPVLLTASDGAIAQIRVGTSGAAVTFATSQGLTVGDNGILTLTAESTANSGTYAGALTIAGGLLDIAAAPTSGGGSVTSILNGKLTMTSGQIVLTNSGTGVVTGRRLQVNDDVNITGGSIELTGTSGAPMLMLNGATNVLNPDSIAGNLRVVMADWGGTSTLTTNQELALMTLRGYGIKEVARTAGNTIGAISLIDGQSNPSQGTTLQLGSDLTVTSGAALPYADNYGQTPSSGAIQLGVDTNGHTMDMTAGDNGGVWQPNNANQSGITTTQWAITNSGTAGAGGIVANGFNFNSSGVETTVGSGVVLEARGGNGSASVLSGTGAIAADSTFRYAGSASAANPATLASNRALGNLEVVSGALLITSLNGIQGNASVDNGRLLLGSGVSLGGTSITLGSAGVLDTTAQAGYSLLAIQDYTFTLDGAGGGSAGMLIADGLDITNGVVGFALSSALDDDVYIFAQYGSLTGSVFASISDLPENYEIDYNYGGLNQIALVAVPEPGMGGYLLAGAMATLGCAAARRRRMA